VLHPELGDGDDGASREEFRRLATSAGVTVVASLRARCGRPDPAFLVGSGKADELADAVAERGAGLILVNARLSPVQERNLSRRCACPVLDRTTLILDIFAQRARSHEGKLQVELAQLRHLSTRLVRGWTHLERQRGGIGLRGPGETQLETDRRLLAQRIRYLSARLSRVERRRKQGRRARARGQVPLVALVGYTNAGKSTLFNRITRAEVVARDQLFATLDPTVRRLTSDRIGALLISDTVGFIRDLPHELIAAFRATLEETLSASLVVHLIDAADPDRLRQQTVVEEVLEGIGAGDLPRLRVYNKADRIGRAAGIERDADGRVSSAWISAATGEGLEGLLMALAERVGDGHIRRLIHLPVECQNLRARLFAMGVVREEHWDDSGASHLEVELTRREARRLTVVDGRDGILTRQLLVD